MCRGWVTELFQTNLHFPGPDLGFPAGGGANPPGWRQHMILPNFAKNCMKLRTFWAVGFRQFSATVFRSKGGSTDTLPSLSNFFHFHAFFGKNLINDRLAYPSLRLGPHPLGNSASATDLYLRNGRGMRYSFIFKSTDLKK